MPSPSPSPSPSPYPMDPRHADASSILRIDRFTCPLEHWPAFAARLAFIDGHLRQKTPCRMSRIASSQRDGMVFVITIAEWTSREALLAAKGEMTEIYARHGFDPAAFMAQHGIESEFATFETMPA